MVLHAMPKRGDQVGFAVGEILDFNLPQERDPRAFKLILEIKEYKRVPQMIASEDPNLIWPGLGKEDLRNYFQSRFPNARMLVFELGPVT
jgi:hypothetical protein